MDAVGIAIATVATLVIAWIYAVSRQGPGASDLVRVRVSVPAQRDGVRSRRH